MLAQTDPELRREVESLLTHYTSEAPPQTDEHVSCVIPVGFDL